uniref:Retrotransposon gag domain-containing protein n=1 Tax=Chromera velia CCMP2878 TaxID=1169474 RepID=A0A0G4HC85_9ALVE|eukprot:Cvel_26130.t1-p1 / transcript=Cvel_26130.t1 / gene=Cvel_26130 / organism=Chromera_velia_CCMP2878 / gene_product=hypothetical protein / transcript_product=hypothetical protein / location=Cvel_scaffold3060:989-2102(+) / protein_length=327 / sequence_SO=supercontig / SO=protein_coding / is_pseudo=false
MREYIQLSDIQVSKQLGSVRQYFSRFLKQWYDKTQRSASPFVNVEDLFTRLSERFPDPNKQTDLRGEVRNVHCQGNEGVHKYSVRFNDIAEGIVDVSEIDLMYDYIRGLLDEVRKEVRRRKPDSLDAAMKDAEEAEQLLSGGRKKDCGGQGRDGRSDSHPPLRPQNRKQQQQQQGPRGHGGQRNFYGGQGCMYNLQSGVQQHYGGLVQGQWGNPVIPQGLTPPPGLCPPPQFQGNPPQWSQRQQQNAPPRGMYATTGGRTGRRGKLITFHGTVNSIPIHALWDPGADSIYVSKRVVETGEFRLSALEPSTYKRGIRLDGAQASLTTV